MRAFSFFGPKLKFSFDRFSGSEARCGGDRDWSGFGRDHGSRFNRFDRHDRDERQHHDRFDRHDRDDDDRGSFFDNLKSYKGCNRSGRDEAEERCETSEQADAPVTETPALVVKDVSEAPVRLPADDSSEDATQPSGVVLDVPDAQEDVATEEAEDEAPANAGNGPRASEQAIANANANSAVADTYEIFWVEEDDDRQDEDEDDEDDETTIAGLPLIDIDEDDDHEDEDEDDDEDIPFL